MIDSLNMKDVVTAKVVFDLKYNHDTGQIQKYKARLVARGFSQTKGVNFSETYAPTMAYDAFRILMATAAKHGWTIRQLDVVTAFLAGRLKEKVYLRVPDELIEEFGRYVQIIGSMYGLKQAAKVWFDLLQGFLESIGFISTYTDECILINHSTGVHIVIGVYVDDLLITGENETEIEKVVDKLKARFNMKDLKEARNVLGMRILRDGQKLSIDQARYAAEIVEEFYYDDAKIWSTPMDTHAVADLELFPGDLLTGNELFTFLRLLGKLNFLCNTRADIVFATHKIQQYCARAGTSHWKALLRIVGYIAGTLTHGMIFGQDKRPPRGVDNSEFYTQDHEILAYTGNSRKNDLIVEGYSDTDYASDLSDRKSITGLVVMVNGACASFGSTKQKGVTKATCEAEYCGMSDTARRVLWVRIFVASIQGKEISWDDDGSSRGTMPIPILYGDNSAAVTLTQGLKSTSKIRHVATSFHHILDEVKKGSIKTYWIPGADMLADGFTKPLPRPIFERNRDLIGIRDVEKIMGKALRIKN